MSDFSRRIDESSIPFPQRRLLALELEQDFAASGASADAEFNESDWAELEEIHSARFELLLKQLGRARRSAETVLLAAPLTVAAAFISKEGTVIEFIREGGAGMYVILAIGAILIVRELQNIFRLLLIKDHSKNSLRLDTHSLILGCFALIFFGVSMSLLGVYVSANATFASGESMKYLLQGAKESLTPSILSTLLAAFVVLIHYTTRRILHLWQAPITG